MAAPPSLGRPVGLIDIIAYTIGLVSELNNLLVGGD